MKEIVLNNAQRILVLIGFIVLILVIYNSEKQVDEPGCWQRGVAYYKSIGSYPRLSNGDLAEAAAMRKCKNSPIAF